MKSHPVIERRKSLRPPEKPKSFFNHCACDWCWALEADQYQVDDDYVCEDCLEAMSKWHDPVCLE